jgi:ankyrin repeat protein
MNSLVGGRLTNVISELTNHSLLRMEGDMGNVHGALQKICRIMLKDNKKEFDALAKALGLLKTKVKNFDSISYLRPHVLSVWNYAYIYDKLIENFIVEDIVDKKPHINFFHLIAGGTSFAVFKKIVEKIEDHFPEKLEKIIFADDGRSGMPVHYAASNEDPQALKLLIEKGANVDAKKTGGLWTPLHLAVQNLKTENVRVLLAEKVQIDAKTNLEFTSLHFAARSGCTDIVEILLNHGADVNAGCNRKFTPLHFAVKMQHIEVVRLLLNHPGVDVNAENEHKLTPLYFAAKAGDSECVKVLLQSSANPNAMDTGNFTPLHIAACNGHVDVVAALLESGETNVDLQTTKGNTALHLAAEKGHPVIMKALIEKNANFDIRNEEYKEFKLTILHLAAKAGYLECVKALLQRGANPNATDSNNFTPLYFAVHNGHLDVVTALLESSEIDVDLQTTKGNTALHLAAEKDNLEIVTALIMNKAKIDVKNDEDKLASDLASEPTILNVLNHPKNKNSKQNQKRRQSSCMIQ